MEDQSLPPAKPQISILGLFYLMGSMLVDTKDGISLEGKGGWFVIVDQNLMCEFRN